MTIGERIKYRRQELGISADELASRLGKNRATIYRYESNDIENLPLTVLEPLAKALQTTPAYIMGWTDDKSTLPPYANIHPVQKKRLPVLSAIACGQPILRNEEQEFYIDITTDIHIDYVLIAKGDSMIGARIYDGDPVFIRKQDTLENGEIGAIAIGDEATLKRFYYYPERNLVILKAENPAYEDMVYQSEELAQVRILGKAIMFQSAVR